MLTAKDRSRVRPTSVPRSRRGIATSTGTLATNNTGTTGTMYRTPVLNCRFANWVALLNSQSPANAAPIQTSSAVDNDQECALRRMNGEASAASSNGQNANKP